MPVGKSKVAPFLARPTIPGLFFMIANPRLEFI
jgi:hypothetical protein